MSTQLHASMHGCCAASQPRLLVGAHHQLLPLVICRQGMCIFSKGQAEMGNMPQQPCCFVSLSLACSFDDECRAVVRENMEKRGVKVHLQTNPTK